MAATAKIPPNAKRGPSIAEKQRFMVNNKGILTIIPHNPPSSITETISAIDAIKVKIIVAGKIHLTQKSSFTGNSLYKHK
ncbi:MAG: hypothetical protein K2N27_04535 [Ruminococcus sp.]|nr:hypothetical protein [Ruminococcus sp.]